MTSKEEHKIKQLIEKYNSVLSESMACSLTEDLFNLIIVNRDDTDFELAELLKDKENLKAFVLKEFIRLNNQPITSELKEMEEVKISLVKSKQHKLGI